MGYTKLFSEIIMSTVWRESDTTRILWITMLALRDRLHRVDASVPGLADAARISIKQCQEGLTILSSPDPHSRTKDHEGRRIRDVDGGWEILNGEKYRNKMSADDRREYKRIKQKEYRQKEKDSKIGGQKRGQNSPQWTQTESETKKRLKEKEIKNKEKEKSDLYENPKILDLYMDAWNSWVTHRKKTKRRRYTTTQNAQALARLPRDKQSLCVNDSIRNEYDGLFPQNYETDKKLSKHENPAAADYAKVHRFIKNQS